MFLTVVSVCFGRCDGDVEGNEERLYVRGQVLWRMEDGGRVEVEDGEIIERTACPSSLRLGDGDWRIGLGEARWVTAARANWNNRAIRRDQAEADDQGSE